MLTALIYALIQILIICAVAWIIVYILGAFGVPIPAPVIPIIWAIAGLLCILVLLNVLTGGAMWPHRALVDARPPAREIHHARTVPADDPWDAQSARRIRAAGDVDVGRRAARPLDFAAVAGGPADPAKHGTGARFALGG